MRKHNQRSISFDHAGDRCFVVTCRDYHAKNRLNGSLTGSRVLRRSSRIRRKLEDRAFAITDAVSSFRADLVARKLSEKRINNILLVLLKALRYAFDCELIAKVPKLGLFKVERPEIVAWDFEQYARLLAAAKADGEDWYAAVCLAGEAGLRVGEVKALRWREDVDMIAKTITVNRQTCNGKTTPPKGRTRRVVQMTSTLHEALKRMETICDGFVVRYLDGNAKRDGDTDHAIARICRGAGLPVRYWHTLRHTFGTHAALFGVNPWRLQTWLGHKRIDETMLYVHVAEAHVRELPEHVRKAARRKGPIAACSRCWVRVAKPWQKLRSPRRTP